MALSPGTRLGPYEIQTALGAGGMGEVYKARDTRLDRSVAVKVLPPAIAGDATLRQRFEREGRAVAALDHPHICGIYDVGEHNGHHFFVMPHLDGETLAERLLKGRLPLAQALIVAAQIADALDRAHRHGIIHRDLKPANIMLAKAGASSASSPQAKLLDFGLAKLKAPVGPISVSGIERLATTSPGTEHGILLGTVQYMAPEQLEGREADARSDIWALGAVLFEMITGARVFGGETPAAIIGSILKDEPKPISSVVLDAPPALGHLVERCLAKDADERWQSAADVRHQIEWIAQTLRDPAQTFTAERRPRRRVASVATVAAISAATFVGGAFAVRQFLPVPSSSRDAVRFTVSPPRGALLSPAPVAAAAQLAISPDGRQLAYIAAQTGGVSEIWLHAFQFGRAEPLPGTKGASFPFWAPDSRSLGFFADGKLKRIDLGAGTPQPLADASNGRGGTWNANGDILFTPAPTSGISRVSARGGPVTQETTLSEELTAVTHYWPQFLPDGRHFLYYQRSRTTEHQGTYVKVLGADAGKQVLKTSGMALFTADHLLYVRDAELFAVRLDVQTLETRGEPVRILAAENVGHFAGTLGGYVSMTASPGGALAYGPSVVMSTALQWRNRTGSVVSTVTPPRVFRSPRLSPDETSVAVAMLSDALDPDIYVFDLARGGRTRVTSDPGNDWFPVWSHDGRRVFFGSTRGGSPAVYQKEPSATTDGDPVVPTRFRGVHATDASRDGQYVITHEIGRDGGYDLGVVTLAAPERTSPFLATRFNEVQARFSPNQRWVAYASDESGRFEIYVRPFPASSGVWSISVGGGTQPEWRRDGKELFFVSADGKLMAAEVITDGATFAFRPPQAMFPVQIPEHVAPYPNDYAVGADGQRFLVNSVAEQTVTPPLTVILNWVSDLTRR